MYDLERKGGSIIGGVLKLIQDRKANPPPSRDPRLPPKPKGQTVGSFSRGLQELPEAMAENMQDVIRQAGPALASHDEIRINLLPFMAAKGSQLQMDCECR